MTEQQKISVSEMLLMTGTNTAEFMKQVADHITKMEAHIVKLEQRIVELEGQADDFK